MMDGALKTRVEAILRLVGKMDEGTLIDIENDIYQDLGIQSTAALDLLLSLEDEFNIAIPDEDFGEARKVSQIYSLIESLA